MKALRVILSLAVLVQCPTGMWCYPGGAPPGVCQSLTPSPAVHKAETNLQLPYNLIAKEQMIDAGQVIELVLEKQDPSNSDFIGFVVQGRDATSGVLTGTFVVDDSDLVVKKMTCSSVLGSSVTHKSKEAKTKVTLKWKAPNPKAEQTIEFKFTVMMSKETHWIDRSGSHNVVVAKGTVQAGPAAKPADQAEPTAKTKHPIYKECMKTKGCFGSPAGCEAAGSCKMLVTYAYKASGKKVDFQLHGKSLGSTQYIAVGLSNDAKMGEDLVFSCSKGGSSVAARWNAGKSNKGGVTGFQIADVKGETKDGATTCDFSVPRKVKANGVDFDFELARYFLLVAMGEESGGNLQYHSSKLPSGASISLKEVGLVEAAKPDYLIQVHGVLMVLAWVSSATCGMLIARYYKETWKNVKPLGKDVWFRSHQGFMGVTVLFSFISFWVIVAKVGFLDYSKDFIAKNPHPATGMSCIICALIQPVMAFFRPHPGTDKRWVFDWAHWFVGNAAFLLAATTLFLAVDLNAAQLDVVMSRLLIAFIVIHVLAHLALTIQQALVTKSNVRDSFNVNNEDQDLKGSMFRKVLVIVYVVFVWAVGIACCVLIFQGKAKEEES